MFRQHRQNLIVPGFVLVPYENMHRLGDVFQLLLGGEPIRAEFPRSVLDALKKTGNSNLHEFVQIVRGDGQEFHALKKRVPDVPGLFQYAAIELQPPNVAVEVVLRIVESNAFHKIIVGTKTHIAPALQQDERVGTDDMLLLLIRGAACNGEFPG